METKMQSQRVQNDEVSLLTSRVVGTRGANAAQRAAAARAFHFLKVSAADNDDTRPTPTLADLHTVRRPDSPAPAAPAQEAPADDRTAAASTAARLGRRKLALIGLAAAVVLAGGGWYGYHWLTVGRFIVSTDDAYVRADATTLAAKVSGYVSAIGVADNSYVHAGDVIARIDDGDYQLAVAAARDKVATQEAAVTRIGEQIPAQQAAVDQARAQLASAQASVKRWQAELQRQQALARNSFASQQTLEKAQASHDQAVANAQHAQAAITAAAANVDVLRAQKQEAARQVQELKTALAKAERDLSFTVIRAPIDGVIGNRAMRVGDFVQTGQRLASLVPLTDVYVDANFKETQLARLRPGQPVSISVDALPDRTINATVASVSPASGSVFSLLPPDNATGNFTKIVQRLAVRIRLPAEVTDHRLLRPGMSVVVAVNTKPHARAAADSRWVPAADGAPHWQSAKW
jgi:membrane fusion protein (multidrug efflux system)